ncbi:hypothetical protein OROGR_021180 [Orobanche gracilis]
MGRVKLQIKKIENTTNRQVTFSKRRNGIIKKAYELSVLCDVDVALVMFSPSGRLSIFSGNRSIEEIITRYVNLPEHERGRVYLQRAIGKLKSEADPIYHHATTSPGSMIDSQEIQQEILKCKCQLEDMKKKLRVYEGHPNDITTLCEAEYRERILEENLKQIRLRKHYLQQDQFHYSVEQTSQGMNLPSEETNVNILAARNSDNASDWFPLRDPQVQILNFLDSNGLLPLRDQPERMDNILPPSFTLVHAPSLHVYNHASPSRGVEEDTQPPEFGQAIDVKLSSWTELYPEGTNHFPTTQPRERALLECFLSELTPVGQDHI